MLLSGKVVWREKVEAETVAGTRSNIGKSSKVGRGKERERGQREEFQEVKIIRQWLKGTGSGEGQRRQKKVRLLSPPWRLF